MSTSEPVDPNVTRRRAMQIFGAAALATTGAGQVAAAGGDLNYQSDMTPNPEVRGTVAVASHELGTDDPFAFTDDDGEDTTLQNWGAYLRKETDDGDPNNPVLYRANWLDADEFGDMPRDETYEDADGNEVEVSVLEATRWDEVDADVAVADWEPASGGDGIKISASNMTDGNTVTAKFEDGGSDWDFLVEDGIGRKYLQIGMNIADLPAGSVIDFKVFDSTGSSVSATVDTSGDTSNDDVIADATATGLVYQRELGEWSTSLDDISKIEVAISDANAAVEIFGLNVERESAWNFGTEEYLNSDDEVETRTIEEPSGDIEIVDPDTVGSEFSGGTISDIEYDVGLRSSGQPDGHVDIVEDADPGRYSFEERLKVVQSLEVPSVYDLSWSGLSLVEEVRHPSDRYRLVETATGLTEEETVTAFDDDDLSVSDQTSTMENGADGDVVELVASVSAGDFHAVYHDLLLTADEKDEITASGAVAGGPFSGGGGSFLTSPTGILTAVSSGVIGYLGLARGWFSSILG